jgi:hypothetical protein
LAIGTELTSAGHEGGGVPPQGVAKKPRRETTISRRDFICRIVRVAYACTNTLRKFHGRYFVNLFRSNSRFIISRMKAESDISRSLDKCFARLMVFWSTLTLNSSVYNAEPNILGISNSPFENIYVETFAEEWPNMKCSKANIKFI